MAVRLVRLPEVEHQIGMSRSTIYKLLKTDPTFPQRRYINGNKSMMVFSESEVQNWIAAQTENTTAKCK